MCTPNVKKNEKNQEKNNGKINKKIIINKKNLKLNFHLYFDFSSHFILSVRTKLATLEKKKEKNNILLNSILQSPNLSNSGIYMYVYVNFISYTIRLKKLDLYIYIYM
jgi:hypothetical protein